MADLVGVKKEYAALRTLRKYNDTLTVTEDSEITLPVDDLRVLVEYTYALLEELDAADS